MQEGNKCSIDNYATDFILWQQTPSQILNVCKYVGYIVCWLIGIYMMFFITPQSHLIGMILTFVTGCLLVFPPLLLVYDYLYLTSIEYTLNPETLITTQGLFSKTVDHLELYRINDYSVEQPLLLRLFGLSNVIIDSTDSTHPILHLKAITDADGLLGILRQNVETCKNNRRVVEVVNN